MDLFGFLASLASSLAWPLLAVGAVVVSRPQIRAAPYAADKSLPVGPVKIEFADAGAVAVKLRARTLSPERIVEGRALNDAVLRLETARARDGVTVPTELADSITAFWRQPETLGLRPGGEADVQARRRSDPCYRPT